MNQLRKSLHDLVDHLDISEVKKVMRFTEMLHKEKSIDSYKKPTISMLKVHRREILEAASRNLVKRVEVFGSVVRDESDEFSDIDLLVDMEESASLLDLIGFKTEVEEILGVTVDVISRRGLKGEIKEQILKEVSPL